MTIKDVQRALGEPEVYFPGLPQQPTPVAVVSRGKTIGILWPLEPILTGSPSATSSAADAETFGINSARIERTVLPRPIAPTILPFAVSEESTAAQRVARQRQAYAPILLIPPPLPKKK